MNLQLGIIRSCLGDRCRIRLLDGGATLEVGLDRRAKDRTRLRFGQLVVLGLQPEPAVLWRWHRVQVIVLRPDQVIVALPEGRIVSAAYACCSPADFGRSWEAWVTLVDGS